MYALMSCATMLIEIEPPSAKSFAAAAPTVTLTMCESNAVRVLAFSLELGSGGRSTVCVQTVRLVGSAVAGGT